MMRFDELRDMHKGRPAAVLGGGPSLPGDLQQVPGGALLVAVNEHASCIGVAPDVLVFMDDPAENPILWQVAKDFDGLKVSQLLEYTDVDLRGSGFWNGPGSDKAAVWLACHFGCDPVLLCGMDLYQGPVLYCHRVDEFEYRPINRDIPLTTHLLRWRAGFERCPGIERVRAVSGPLVEMFGKSD